MFGSKQKIINRMRDRISKLEMTITESILDAAAEKERLEKKIEVLQNKLKEPAGKSKEESPPTEDKSAIGVLNKQIQDVSKIVTVAHEGLLKNIMGDVDWDYIKTISEKQVDERDPDKIATTYFEAVDGKNMSIHTFIQLANATVSILTERCVTNEDLSKALEKIDTRWKYASFVIPANNSKIPGTGNAKPFVSNSSFPGATNNTLVAKSEKKPNANIETIVKTLSSLKNK